MPYKSRSVPVAPDLTQPSPVVIQDGSPPNAAKRRPPFLVRLVGAETPLQTREALQGYLFASPWLLGLVMFVVGPILASFYLSLSEYSVLSPLNWVGLANYRLAFFEDELFWPSLGRTFYYALATVPISVLGSLLLANLLNQKLIGTSLFRTIFYLPHLTPTVAAALLWTYLLHPQLGVVNAVLGGLGLPQPGWFTETGTVIPALILVSTWTSVGGNRMIIFLAALQGVPTELYDAAAIDGAGAIAKLRHITVPMISPAILFNLVLGVIGALRVFGLAYVATEGGPGYGSYFIALHIFNQGFRYFRMGYAAALAWFLAIVLLILTAVQLKISGRWVYYAGGS